MFFSRMMLRGGAPKSPEFLKAAGDEYFLHQAVWQVFGDNPDRRRDFLYRLDYAGRVPLIYVVSERQPSESTEFWAIDTKRYEPRISQGTRLGFLLRANPTCKRDGKRHDVVMNEKTKVKSADGESKVIMADIVQATCKEWLTSRAAKNGFQVEQVRADGYRQCRFHKKNTGVTVQYSTVDFTGVLRVMDTESFLRTLFGGLGAEKGFGCGLLLVRRI